MKIYAKQQIVEILKINGSNNFNRFKTSSETGVARITIREWADTMVVQVFSYNNV